MPSKDTKHKKFVDDGDGLIIRTPAEVAAKKKAKGKDGNTGSKKK